MFMTGIIVPWCIRGMIYLPGRELSLLCVQGDATCLIIVAAISFTPFLSFLCYRTYRFPKIHSNIHSNVHYCSLSFTLTMVLLFCIHIICNFVIEIERGLRMMKVWRSFSARRFSCRWRTFSARHSNQASLLLCSRLGVLWHVGTKSGKNLKCVVNKLKVAEKAVT